MRWLKYPYTNFHELNLDWLVENMEKIDLIFDEIKAKLVELEDELGIQTERIDVCLDAINYIQAHYRQMMASEYDETRQYEPGEIIRYDDEIYICLPGQTPGPWDGNYWRQTTIGDELGDLIYKYTEITVPAIALISQNISELYTLFDIIGKEYDPNNTYYAGQVCHYEGKEYICITGGATGTFDPSKWNEISINALLDNIAILGSSISEIRNIITSTYDDTLAYATGDYVLQNAKLYKALQPVPVGYDPQLYPAYWTEVTIGSELKSIRNIAVDSHFEKMTFTLTAGSTQIPGVAPLSGEDSALLIFTSIFGVNPTNITQSLGIFTIEFPAQAVDMDVLVFAYPTN